MNDKKYDGVYYKVRKVTDIKDLIEQSAELYAEDTAYLEKCKATGKFEPITYAEVKGDIDALGTKFMEMGLADEKIAVIGETSYYWLLTYFATVCGVGVIVPLDKNLPDVELMGLIERSGAEAICFSKKVERSIRPLLEKPGSVKHFIRMDAGEHVPAKAKAELAKAEQKEAAESAAPAAEEAAEPTRLADIADAGNDALTEDKNSEEVRVLSLPDLIEAGKELLESGDMTYLDRSVDPDQMSTLLFTSGTTGAAKGVMLSHRNIVSNCYEMSKFFHIPDPGIVLSILPIHHVYEMTCDIFTTFYQGKTIAICEGIKYIQKNMVEVKANVMLGVPLVFEKMYKGMWKQAKKRGEENKLRRAIDLSKRFGLYKNKTVIRRLFKAIHQSFGGAMQSFIVGGAAADPYIIEEFEAMGLPMIQGYGMSENAPIICLNPDRYRKADAVGKPLPGTKVRIIDQDEDGIGEIIAKGPSVMLGYYGNREATDEAIVNGWLHTGDLGYIDDDGFVHITGRAKTVIVTKGGKNIFPEEVESVLMESDYIEEVIVHGVKDDRVGNVMITADIYPHADALKKKKLKGESAVYHFFRDLIEEINGSLPPYKQVKRINIRKEPFIKTTTGKIKRFGNKLSGAEQAKGMDEHEKKFAEVRKARDMVEQIRQQSGRFVTCPDIRPVADIKDIIYTSADRYESRTACIQKIKGEDVHEYLSITYKQLTADMDGLGTALLNRDLGGKKVAIIGHNCYRWQISYLAVTCGVGVACPIECDLNADEMARRIKDAGCEIAIFEAPLKETITAVKESGKTDLKVLIDYGEALGFGELHKKDVPDKTKRSESGADALYLPDLVEEGKAQVSQGDRQFIDREIAGDEVCSIVYTSGATGEARGVELTHANIAYGVMSCASSIRIDPSDVIYSALPAHVMYEITCGLLLPLYRGATCISSRNGAYSGKGAVGDSPLAKAASARKMCEEMKEVSPTVLVMTPEDLRLMKKLFADTVEERRGSATIYSLMNANKVTKKLGINIMKPFAGSVRALVGGNVRLMVTGGGKVSKETMEYMRMFGVTALQSYWLTECATVAAVDPEKPQDIRFGSVGHLVPGMQVKVVNKGRDGIGEICLKGENVMKGYHVPESGAAEDPAQAEKDAKKAAKEAERAAKKAAKEAEKAMKKAEREAKKAAKEAGEEFDAEKFEAEYKAEAEKAAAAAAEEAAKQEPEAPAEAPAGEPEASVSDGWLHTGDAGFIDEDDFIYLTGRMSDRAAGEPETAGAEDPAPEA